MAPCNPSDVSVDIPDGPSGPAIPGFGVPFTLPIPNINPFPDDFPEDLLDLMDKLQLLIPPGSLKPQLNRNFGKDVFDGIMKLLDQFMPFLMLYKFFLPVLNMIICIIEVLCALMNPFKLIRALKRLFRTCIPEFLNLFPIFALICMIISLLLLLLALIEYIIDQILKLIKALLKNILALEQSFSNGNEDGVLAIAQKLGSFLCAFQNLFVLLAIFNIIIQIIKDILKLLFHIPPCDDGDPSDDDKCCTPDVCPAIIKNGNYTRKNGTMLYFKQLGKVTGTTPAGPIVTDFRPEQWQLWDPTQPPPQKFSNIYDPFDIPPSVSPKPVLYPTDSSFNSFTPPAQAPYTVDLRIFYVPREWGRGGLPRWIRFKNCVVVKLPSSNLTRYNVVNSTENTGVLSIGGGAGYEDDGTTILQGFNSDFTNVPIPQQATLNNFFHQKSDFTDPPKFLTSHEIYFVDVEYTFKPNPQTLLQKNLITIGCAPDFSIDRQFTNGVIAADAAVKSAKLDLIFKSPKFPDPGKTQEELAAAVSALRGNLTVRGVTEFQNSTIASLNNLKANTNSALADLIEVGFDPCHSVVTVDAGTQFTSQPVVVSVTLNEKNGVSLISGLPSEVAALLTDKIKIYTTFGTVHEFVYDGVGKFNANITSSEPGSGKLTVSFDNNIFCADNVPADINIPPTHTLQTVDFQFVYTPSGTGAGIPTAPGSTGSGGTGAGGSSGSDGSSSSGGTSGTGDSTGQPRRDEGDQSRDGHGDE